MPSATAPHHPADTLVVDDLTVRSRTETLVDGVSLRVAPGEAVTLLGASGSGKSLTAAAVLGTLPATLTARGRITLAGRDVPPGRRPRARAGVAAVHQDTLSALNPFVRIGTQLGLTLRAHGAGRDDLARAAAALLGDIGFERPEATLRRLPGELSGGQRQRVCLALAFACKPCLLIADEPTTALDVVTQAQVMDQIGLLRERLGTSVLLITHDRELAAARTDRRLRLAAGRIAGEPHTTSISPAAA